jgi:tetratricopeptide (TPR) repeat protein
VLAGADAATPADGTGWLRADPAGMVIMTTRIRDSQVWGTRVTLRELKPPDDEAGAEVLRDLAPEVADSRGRQARELSRRLGGLPLALHLAGAYLGSPFARWSTFADYRQALDGVELPTALTDIEEHGADIHATVQRTWDLSLDALAAEGRPLARPLLLVLSCFASATPIPAWLLRLPPLAALLGEAENNEAERRGLRAGLQGLSRTGLIEISNSGSPAGVNSVTVHPLVADANRIRLTAGADAEHAAVLRTAVALLEAATAGLDPVKPDDWPTWRLLVPHVYAAVDLLASDLDPAILAGLLTVSAVGTEALLRAGRLAAAQKLAEAGVAAAAFLSGDDPAALAARGYLARSLVRRVLGDDHPDTMATRHRLARIIGLQGRYADAEELCHQVLRDRLRLLGEDHPDNLSTRHRLARMLGLQGRYADAEPMFRQVLAARRRTLGEEHPDTWSTEHRLGWLIGRQGRYSEAIDIVNQVLGGRRHVLGDDHPDTLAASETLAWLTGLRGKPAEADELAREVLADRRRLLGEDHPDTLTSRATLARLTARQDRRAEAEALYRQVTADRTRVPGPGHPDTAVVRAELAQLTADRPAS